jgi:cell fate regulator YaaT (PSP1 superfamily)
MEQERDQLPEQAPDAEGESAPAEAPQKPAGERFYTVRIGQLRRAFSFRALQDLDEHIGRSVVVEADYGLDLGILRGRAGPAEGECMGTITRLADLEDLERAQGNKDLDAEFSCVFAEFAQEEGLGMKVVGLDHALGLGKVTFYYHAEGRVDFRQLVKKLATRLKRRIELYQLNLRDQFMFHAFVGPCGLHLCCKARPELFPEKVPTKYAKQQKLSYNPNKMAGMCGKPRCCLAYELEVYREFSDVLGTKSGRVFRRKDAQDLAVKVVDWDISTSCVLVEAGEEKREMSIDFEEFKREYVRA